MKSLSLEKMESVSGGNYCSNVKNLMNVGAASSVAISAIFITTGVGAVFFGIGMLFSMASIAGCQKGWW